MKLDEMVYNHILGHKKQVPVFLTSPWLRHPKTG